MSELTIEQRAHDIAIAVLPNIVEEKASHNEKVHVADEYIKAYSAFLKYLVEQRDQLQNPMSDFGAQS